MFFVLRLDVRFAANLSVSLSHLLVTAQVSGMRPEFGAGALEADGLSIAEGRDIVIGEIIDLSYVEWIGHRGPAPAVGVRGIQQMS
jgi:hypothetical protein